MFLRVNAPGVMTRWIRAGQDASLIGASSGLVVTRLPAPVYRIIPLGVPFKEASLPAVLSTTAVRLHGRLRRKHRCTCDSVRPLDQPEGLVSALHSITSETGKPKVIGLYPPQVSGALISQRSAKGLNAGRSLAGWPYSLNI